MSEPRVSVVVITHNRCDELDATLTRLAGLPERAPVVVVDNASTDGTADMVRTRHPAVTLLEPGSNLGAVGRNLGVATVDSPYVAFCDDDTWWDPGALGRAVTVLDLHPRLALITGRIVVEPSGVDDPICAELAASPIALPGGVPGHGLLSFLAGASVVRRSAFEACGGFSDRLWLGGEEELLGSDLASAGWAMSYLPEVVCHHRPSVARDPHLRRRHGIRNTLWFTWLRRPLPSALRRTAELVRTVPRDRLSVLAFADAIRGAIWVCAARAPVSAELERGYRALEQGPRERRYVS